MVHCAVPMCKTNSKIDKKMSFHQFPCDEKRLQLWLQNINQTNPMGSDWTPNQYATICGLHFMEKDFKPSLKNRILKPDAVPTIFQTSKDSKPNVGRPKRKRKISIPKKTPNKENISADENIELMDIDDTSGSVDDPDQADFDEEQGQAGSDAEQDKVSSDVEQHQDDSDAEQDQGGSDAEQHQAGTGAEQDQVGSNVEQNQSGSAENLDQVDSDGEQDQADSDGEKDQFGSEVEHGQSSSEGEDGFDVEIDQAVLELEKVQADSSFTTESNKTCTPTSKRAKVDAAKITSETLYPISNIKQIHTPKHLKALIRESKIKCAEKKLALVKEKLASKVVSRALQKALVVSKIKAETAKSDYYEKKKIFLLQTKISHLKNEVPVSEEKFQTFEYLKSKSMEEEMATRIEERALQKQLFEAEIQASNEKQTYYVTKKTWLPIFMDHSNMK